MSKIHPPRRLALLKVKGAPEPLSCTFAPGPSLREILDTTRLRVRSACGGAGSCGRCRIRLKTGEVNAPTKGELALRSIDAVQGIRRIGGNGEAYRKQLHRFREHYAGAADELQRLIAEQGAAAAEVYCHGLKGVSGNLGATELFACVTDLDDLLKQDKLPPPTQVAGLRHLLAELQAGVAGCAWEEPVAEIGAKVELFAIDEALALIKAFAPEAKEAK